MTMGRIRIQVMTSSPILLLLIILGLFFSFSSPPLAAAETDTLNTAHVFKHGDSLVSSGGSFALGFFTLSSSSTYLGIWYNSLPDKNQTVVWVANREFPINDSSASLQLSTKGLLTLRSQSGSLVWSSNSSSSSGSDPVCQLLDTGNLVIRDTGVVLWQSFDFPGDTLLPEVKLGWDFRTGLERYLSNWKSEDDPSKGNFSYRFDPRGYPEVVVMENSVVRYRLGPWNGLVFSGKPQLKYAQYNFEVVVNEEEAYYSFYLMNSSILSRLVMESSGMVQRYMWVDGKGWQLYLSIQNDNCDPYALCGAYGSCSLISFPICSCLAGFVPRIQGDWDSLNWSSGCVRNATLNCSTDGFRKYEGVKLPETAKSWHNLSLSDGECRDICAKNCSCMAYSSLDIRNGGSGCLLWFGDLIDMRTSDSGQDIFIRMPASELAPDGNAKNKVRLIVIILVCAIIATVGLYCRRNKQQRHMSEERMLKESLHMEDAEEPHFDFSTMSCPTDNFSFNNMIGEGGFGPVYKGVLKEGQQVAVEGRTSMESVSVSDCSTVELHMMGLGLSSQAMERNQSLLSGDHHKGDFRSMLQEPELEIESSHQGLQTSFRIDSSAAMYGGPTPVFQGLLGAENQHSPYENRTTPMSGAYPYGGSYGGLVTSDQLPASWSNSKVPQLHFSNNVPFWNASASSRTISDVRPSFFPSLQPQFPSSSFEQKPKNLSEVRDSSAVAKKSGSETSTKSPRSETASPMPPFKARKVKMGDRITALQQLVSPFGKTDTASVLSEAIEYIKFLHEQVTVLSIPYMKSGAPIHHQQSSDRSKDPEGQRQDLRSRGLCLVPVSST